MQPFEVLGLTVTFTAATTPPTPVQATSFDGVRTTQVLLTNVGAVAAFVAWGQTADEATANAIVPTSTPTRVYPLLPGTQAVITLASGMYFTADTSSSTAIVYATCGIGA